MNILINWLVSSVVILVLAFILPGVSVEGLMPALGAALVLGIINALIKPILIILTLPINILTLGLFTLVINAFLVMLAAAVVPGFAIASFWWALLFGVALSLVSAIIPD